MNDDLLVENRPEADASALSDQRVEDYQADTVEILFKIP